MPGLRRARCASRSTPSSAARRRAYGETATRARRGGAARDAGVGAGVERRRCAARVGAGVDGASTGGGAGAGGGGAGARGRADERRERGPDLDLGAFAERAARR